MIITIFTGGSGSTNIQQAIYNIHPTLSLNLVINGYDDGKSTGVLRNLFPDTLGISDFRKNQTYEYKLRNGDTHIYKILNHRFTTNEPRQYLIDLINHPEMQTNPKLYDFFLHLWTFKTPILNVLKLL